MSAFTDHRARRLWAAHEYVGWDMPPYPFEREGRKVGRVVMTGRLAGFYGNGSKLKNELDVTIKLKEKAQNRKHFQ